MFSNDLENFKYDNLKKFDAVSLNHTVGQIFVDPAIQGSNPCPTAIPITPVSGCSGDSPKSPSPEAENARLGTLSRHASLAQVGDSC